MVEVEVESANVEVLVEVMVVTTYETLYSVDVDRRVIVIVSVVCGTTETVCRVLITVTVSVCAGGM